MKKNIVIGLLILLPAAAFGHSNTCDYSMDYNIEIDNKTIRFSDKNNEFLVFSKSGLTINGEAANLTSEQQLAAKRLQDKTRQVVPQIAEIAIEGAELGVKAASLVVAGLFGDDEDIHKDLIKPIESISEKIKANVKAHSLNTLALEASFDESFEKEVEALVSKAISKYSGKFVGQILGSLFSGDEEEMKDFEFRMENLEQDIETYVEGHADQIEKKADSLCESITELARLDKELESVANYPKDGIIKDGDSGHFKVSGMNLTY